MHALRRSVLLGRLLMGWFLLALGVAMAAPLVQPHSIGLVCSSSGGTRLIVLDETGQPSAASPHATECPMCLAMAPPPAPPSIPTEPAQPLGDALRPFVAAHLAARVGAPLPPRGPPLQA